VSPPRPDADIRADMNALDALLADAATPLIHTGGYDAYTLVPSRCVDPTGR
jgi:hypothetical protein